MAADRVGVLLGQLASGTSTGDGSNLHANPTSAHAVR